MSAVVRFVVGLLLLAVVLVWQTAYSAPGLVEVVVGVVLGYLGGRLVVTGWHGLRAPTARVSGGRRPVIAEVAPRDRVRHTSSGREGTVLELRSRYSQPEAKVQFDEPSWEPPRWVPRISLERIDAGRTA